MAFPLLAVAGTVAPVAAGWAKDKFLSNSQNSQQTQNQQMSFGQVNNRAQNSGSENSGFMGQYGNVGAGLAGAVTGAGLAYSDFEDGQSLSSKARNMVGKGLAGAGAGVFTKLANDAIQAEGGSMKASAYSAIAGGLGSYLKDGGPGVLKSAMASGMAGFGADKVHDNLAESGHEGLADSLSGAIQGGGLGYSTLGGLTGTGIGSATGGLAGLAQNYFGGGDDYSNAGTSASGFGANQVSNEISTEIPQFANLGQPQRSEIAQVALPQESRSVDTSYDQGYEV